MVTTSNFFDWQLRCMEALVDALESAKGLPGAKENTPIMCAISSVQMAMGYVEEAKAIIKDKEEHHAD